MTRRAQGEGSLYFDRDRRRWVGQASAGVNPATGKRRRLKVVGAEGESKSDVARRLSVRIRESSSSSEITTVGALVEDWLAKAAPARKSAAWLETSRNLVESHVLPGLSKAKLAAISVEDIESWMGELSKRLSLSTLVKVRSQLALAFDYGIRRRIVDWNPARIAEMPSATTPPREGRTLTPSEARNLLNIVADHRLGAWIVTTLTLGLRPGETSGLCWDSVDLDSGLIIVHRSLSWLGNVPSLKETKTKRPRTLDAPARTIDALRDHRKRQFEERLMMGDRWSAKWSDLVFVSEAGTPLIPANLRRLVSDLAVAAGIEGKVTPYTLRHSATSLLSASGVPPELLADMLGHRDTRMVHKHYRHPVTPTVSVARDNIEDALGL